MSKVGEVYVNNQGLRVEIIKYDNAHKVTIRFDDGYERVVEYSNIKRGTVKNPMHPNVYGKGFTGDGEYKAKESGVMTRSYVVWLNILRRVYSNEEQIKKPCYIGTSICEEWHNYQNFARWYEENEVEGWHVDKDILGYGKKLYSPDTCCFVPSWLNSFMTNMKSTNNTGVTGVTFREGRYKVRISDFCKSRSRQVGSFYSLQEAQQAYKKHRDKNIYLAQIKALEEGVHPSVIVAIGGGTKYGDDI